MSRIGKLPISIPSGVEIKKDEKSHVVTVKGPLGELHQYVDPDVPDYNVVTFGGSYSTNGNDKLVITGEKFNVSDNRSEQVIYDLDIITLTKSTLMVSGTIKYNRYMDNSTDNRTSTVSLTLTRK